MLRIYSPNSHRYLGYLDATELYPDFRPTKFVEFARELLDGKMEKIYPNLVLPEK